MGYLQRPMGERGNEERQTPNAKRLRPIKHERTLYRWVDKVNAEQDSFEVRAGEPPSFRDGRLPRRIKMDITPKSMPTTLKDAAAPDLESLPAHFPPLSQPETGHPA